VRKAVLLTRFINFMKSYLDDVKNKSSTPTVNEVNGIPIHLIPILDDTNPRIKTTKLSEAQHDTFNKFIKYYSSEADSLGDIELQKELDVLLQILNISTQKYASEIKTT